MQTSTEQYETWSLENGTLWQNNPARWLEIHGSTVAEAYKALRHPMAQVQAEAETLTWAGKLVEPESDINLLRLFATIGTEFQYPNCALEFFRVGRAAFPMSPEGQQTLARMRKRAQKLIQHGAIGSVSAEGSILHDIAEACTADYMSAVFSGARNTTPADSSGPYRGFRLSIDLDPKMMSKRPAGKTLPLPFLALALEGMEIYGIDALECIRDAGMCDEGVSEFLQHFDIPHERSEDEEGGDIDHVEDFTLTEKMILFIYKAGYLDKISEYLGDADEDWSRTLQTSESDALAEMLDGIPDDGITYDTAFWQFTPDYTTLPGFSELERDELAIILPLVTTVALEYEIRGILPPLQGTLQRKASTGARSSEFQWDPSEGTLAHRANSRLSFTLDCRKGSITMSVDGKTAKLRTEGGDILDIPSNAGGADLALWCDLAQNGARL